MTAARAGNGASESGHEDRQPVPVFERIAQPREVERQETERLLGEDHVREAAAEQRQPGGRNDAERQPVAPAGERRAASGEGREREDPDVESRPVEFGEGVLGVVGPDRRGEREDGEEGEQAAGEQGRAAQAHERPQAERRCQNHDPPDSDRKRVPIRLPEQRNGSAPARRWEAPSGLLG